MYGDYLRRGTAEFIGAFTLIFIGAAAVMLSGATGIVGIAIAHGLAIALMVTALGHISGGHFNPAVTLGFVITRRIEPKLAVVYWLEQFAGATCAALLLWWIFPTQATDPAHIGAPALNSAIGQGAGIVLEAILTFFLVLAVFATAVDPRGAFKAVAGLRDRPRDHDGHPLRRPADRRGDEPGTRVRAGAGRERLALVHLDLLRRPGGRRGRRRARSTSSSSCVSRSSPSAQRGPAYRSRGRAISPSPSR